MFGLEYLGSLVIILVNIGYSIVSSIPLWFCWNKLAPVYFDDFLPEKFLNIPYWHFVGLTIISYLIGKMIQNVVPNFINISQNNK